MTEVAAFHACPLPGSDVYHLVHEPNVRASSVLTLCGLEVTEHRQLIEPASQPASLRRLCKTCRRVWLL